MYAVPYEPLNVEEKDKVLSVMRKANQKRKAWAKRFYGDVRSNQKLRQYLIKGIADPMVLNKKEPLSDLEIQKFQEDLPEMISVKDVEYKVIKAYSNLVFKCAHKWSRSKKHDISQDDYFSEAFIALDNAIFSYDEDTTDFSTYAHRAVSNQMRRFYNGSLHIPLSEEQRKLVRKYNKIKNDLNGYSTFDDVVELMEITKREIILLQETFVLVVPHSQMGKMNKDNDFDSQDITYLARSCIVKPKNEDFEFRDNVAATITELSEVEKEVLEASMSPYPGWRAKIARKHINPKTGKKYTRAAVKWILQGVFKKISIQKKVA